MHSRSIRGYGFVVGVLLLGAASCLAPDELNRNENPWDDWDGNGVDDPFDLQLKLKDTTVELSWAQVYRADSQPITEYVIYRATLSERAGETGEAPLATPDELVEVARIDAALTRYLDRSFLRYGDRVEYQIAGFHPERGLTYPSQSVHYLVDSDLDLDGVRDGDCADNYDTVNPGHVELCDGLDNGCNGVIDDMDWDGDGYTCAQGDEQDCDDEDFTVHPNARDGCDGFDNNCDGKIDENGDDADLDGAPGPACGGDDCNDSLPTVLPGAPEFCDRLDNDCDGGIDEDYPELDQACVAGEGVCQRAGVYVCSSNRLGVVCGAVGEGSEDDLCDP